MKTLLIIIPYRDLYPPTNGGMQRSFNILVQLTLTFRVSIIVSQDIESFSSAKAKYPSLASTKIFSTSIQKDKKSFYLLPQKISDAIKYRWYRKSLKGKTDSLFLDYYSTLKTVLKSERFDYVLLEKLSTLNAVKIIRHLSPNSKIIYDAHNVDSDLALISGNKYYSLIKRMEENLYRNVDAILTCSQLDLIRFTELNKSGIIGKVVPNGVNRSIRKFDSGVKLETPGYILFCGSLDYPPNSNGLLWFYNSCWRTIKKAFPQIKFWVVGSGNIPEILNRLKEEQDIVFTGRVDEVTPYYDKAAVAIVPIHTGSGTRLKVLEAMEFGVPIVSTKKGAEGIDYQNLNDIIIADEAQDFSFCVIDLLTDLKKRVQISEEAFKLVKNKYHWETIGSDLCEFIKDIS